MPEAALETGGPASLVVYDAPGEVDALRLIPRRRLVLRRGRVVARTEPARTTVIWDGREEPVSLPFEVGPAGAGAASGRLAEPELSRKESGEHRGMRRQRPVRRLLRKDAGGALHRDAVPERKQWRHGGW